MSPALTPVLALEYLRELSADVRDGIVLGARGIRLAGSPALAPAARELLAAIGGAAEAEGRSSAGVVLAAQGGDLVLVLVLGSQAMPALARHDLRLVQGDLGARAQAVAEPATVPAAVVERLLLAAGRAPGS